MSRTAVPTSVQHIPGPEMAPNGHGIPGTQMKHMGPSTGNMVVGTATTSQVNGMTSPVNGTMSHTPVTQNQRTIPMMSPNMQANVTPPQLQPANGNCVLCGKFAMFLCSSCQKIWYCSQVCQVRFSQSKILFKLFYSND